MRRPSPRTVGRVAIRIFTRALRRRRGLLRRILLVYRMFWLRRALLQPRLLRPRRRQLHWRRLPRGLWGARRRRYRAPPTAARARTAAQPIADFWPPPPPTSEHLRGALHSSGRKPPLGPRGNLPRRRGWSPALIMPLRGGAARRLAGLPPLAYVWAASVPHTPRNEAG